MKTERRHELESNQLANSLGHWADAARPYINTLLAGILVVIVAGAVYFVAQRRTAAGNAKAWDEYFSALAHLDRLKLEDIGEINAGTPAGWWAMCMAAELGLSEGSNQLFRDKLVANDILRRAADRFQQVLGESRDPTLLKQASFGLARVHECLGDVKKAEDEYQAIAEKWSGAPVAQAAEKRAKDLKRMQTREFYDWLAKQDIGKRISPHPSMPGLKSPFNLNILPDSPDQSGTVPGDDATPGSSETPDAPAATTSGGATSEATTEGATSARTEGCRIDRQRVMSDEPSVGEPIELVVPENHAGSRLDWFLAQQLPQYSRVHLRRAINAVGVKVEGHRAKASHRLRVGEHVSMVLPELPRVGPVPENIPLEILYEDAEIAAVNKPPGMVVHPAKGHWEGTLTSALAFHFENLSTAGGPTRPGVVHRLDRDTSGVLVVAKTDAAHMRLATQFEERTTEKEYFAIVVGVPDRDRDLINLPIGPHPSHREKMAIRRGRPDSRESQTFYEVIERFDGFAALKVTPKTGRTHQIRLHLSHIGYPVLCDRLYGGRARITRGDLSRDPSDTAVILERQALHAQRLKIVSPTTGEALEFVAPLPADLTNMLDELRQYRPR